MGFKGKSENDRRFNFVKNCPIPLNGYFVRNKSIILIILIIFFLIVFPFFIYKVVSESLGVIELSSIKKNVEKLDPETTLSTISNYHANYFTQLSILEVQLKALEKIQNPSFKIQIQKVYIIKILLDEAWFPETSLYQKLAKTFYDIDYYQESLYYLEKYMANNNNISNDSLIECHTMLYNISMFTSDYKRSISSAKSILNIYPNDYEWRFKLAQSYLADKQFTYARLELEKLVYSIEGTPQFYDAFFTLVDVLNQLNLKDKTDFYLKYIATTHFSPDKKNFFLSVYAKYLFRKMGGGEAIEKWKASYVILNPKSKGKNMETYFNQYLKS